MGLIQVTSSVTLSNITLPIMFYWINISKIPLLNYIFSILFTHTHTHTHTPSFLPIGCYLLFNLENHLLCTMLNTKA